jgi:hypothetical protein
MKIILPLIAVLCSVVSTAQTKTFNHAAYLEAGGASVIGSINYEFRLDKQSYTGWGLRFGGGVVPAFHKYYNGAGYYFVQQGTKVVGLAGVNYLFPAKNPAAILEMGANLLYTPENSIYMTWTDNVVRKRLIPSAFFGIRRQPLKKGFLLKMGFSPFYMDGAVNAWLGVSAGYKW